MADFTVTETQTTEYKTVTFRKLYPLTAGDKLINKADLVAVANKAVPVGYTMLVGVTIQAKVTKL